MILKNCYDQWIPNIENMVFLAKQRDELLKKCKKLLDSEIYADGEGCYSVRHGGIDDYDYRIIVNELEQAIKSVEDSK